MNDALSIAGSGDLHVGSAMSRFAGFVDFACFIPRSDSVLGNSLAKLSC